MSIGFSLLPMIKLFEGFLLINKALICVFERVYFTI